MVLTEDEVIQILKLIEESNFSELHLEMGDLKLIVRKGGSGENCNLEEHKVKAPIEPVVNENPARRARERETESREKIENEISARAKEDLVAVKSPMLGIFYRCSAPRVPPYVEVGTFVKEDDTVCLIEVMKVFNAVKAGARGSIHKICAESGQLVEYGQTLFFVEPAEKP